MNIKEYLVKVYENNKDLTGVMQWLILTIICGIFNHVGMQIASIISFFVYCLSLTGFVIKRFEL